LRTYPNAARGNQAVPNINVAASLRIRCYYIMLYPCIDIFARNILTVDPLAAV